MGKPTKLDEYVKIKPFLDKMNAEESYLEITDEKSAPSLMAPEIPSNEKRKRINHEVETKETGKTTMKTITTSKDKNEEQVSSSKDAPERLNKIDNATNFDTNLARSTFSSSDPKVKEAYQKALEAVSKKKLDRYSRIDEKLPNIGTFFIKELTDSDMFSTHDIKNLESEIFSFESQNPLSVNDFKKILGLSEMVELPISDSELEDIFQQTVKHLTKNRKLSKPIEKQFSELFLKSLPDLPHISTLSEKDFYTNLQEMYRNKPENGLEIKNQLGLKSSEMESMSEDKSELFDEKDNLSKKNKLKSSTD